MSPKIPIPECHLKTDQRPTDNRIEDDNEEEEDARLQRWQRLIQQQLLLIFHAAGCSPEENCGIPHCDTFRALLEHMIGCHRGNQCTFTYCAASRQIINHWKRCHEGSCPICGILVHLHTVGRNLFANKMKAIKVTTEDNGSTQIVAITVVPHPQAEQQPQPQQSNQQNSNNQNL